MTDRERHEPPVNPLPVLGVGLGVAGLGWLIPQAVVVVASGEVLACAVPRAVIGTLRIVSEGRWNDPASGFPGPVREQMPGPVWWWAIAGAVFALAVLIVLAVVRKVEPEVARERLGRRAYEWRGLRPRSWARPRDLGDLTRRRRARGAGFSLGTLDGRALLSGPEAHVAVVAPTRSGKTTRCIIPWLLEHEGPAIVTSTKRDVLDATREARERGGRLWVYDPFTDDSCSWDPLDRCDDWSTALRQAQWLADATQEGDSEIAGYWRGEAAKLLAPLLHAAALDNQRIAAVLEWLDSQEAQEPSKLLRAAGADAAARQLRSIISLDPRNRGTTFMSAGSVLAVYRFPEVVEHAHPDFTPDRFLDGTPQTLYIVASDRDQRLLTPLIVALLSSVLAAGVDRAAQSGPLNPTLRVLVDEAANIAPLRDLPKVLSQAAGHGIRVATVWQSMAQLQERYRHGAETVLANSTAKLFLGPITDEATRRFVTPLTSGPREATEPRAANTARALQQLDGERALLLAGSRPPAVVRLLPWWRRRERARRQASRPTR
jgi:hypothetical protein